MIFNPFEQFQVQNQYIIEKTFSGILSPFSHSIYITDTVIISFVVILLYYIFYVVLSFRKQRVTRSYILDLFKEIYLFIYGIVSLYLPEEGRKYFPFFFYLFLFISTCNIIGILPYAFTITSHLSITFGLSFMVWFGILIIGFQENGLRYFSLFFPRGIPFRLVPFLILIEVISMVFRSVSLALRLFANIVAGHILLDTLALFIHKMIYPSSITVTSLLVSVLPFIVCMVLIVFEMVVAVLQGYIFVILSCIYLKESFSAQDH